MFIGAYLKYPNVLSLIVIFRLVLFVMAAQHRGYVNLLLASEELERRNRR